MRIISFRAASGNEYELQVKSDTVDIPSEIREEYATGIIYDVNGLREWDSIAEMTHDLKLEIVSWGSDVGD